LYPSVWKVIFLIPPRFFPLCPVVRPGVFVRDSQSPPLSPSGRARRYVLAILTALSFCHPPLLQPIFFQGFNPSPVFVLSFVEVRLFQFEQLTHWFFFSISLSSPFVALLKTPHFFFLFQAGLAYVSTLHSILFLTLFSSHALAPTFCIFSSFFFLGSQILSFYATL